MRTPNDGAYHRMTNVDDEGDSDSKEHTPLASDGNRGNDRRGETIDQRYNNDEPDPNPPLMDKENDAYLPTQKEQRRLFERPDLRSLALYTLCCASIYPFLFVVTLVCKERSLFEVRLFVGLGGTAVSYVMGIFLLKFARRFIEASTWATLLQQTHSNFHDRMTLHELSEISSDPTSISAASRLLLIRRRLRNADSRHLWHTYLLFFAFLVGTGGMLSFTLGRIVDIIAQSSIDYKTFEEVPVFGDVSPGDIGQYDLYDLLQLEGISPSTASGTVPAPSATATPVIFGSHNFGRDSLPPAWRYRLPSHSSINVKDKVVFFAEPYPAQLRSDGTGFGSLNATSKAELLEHPMKQTASSDRDGIHPENSALLRYPQWGTSVVCEKLPDVNSNLLLEENSTTVYLPRGFVSGIYSKLNLVFEEDAFRASERIYRSDNWYNPLGVSDDEVNLPGIVKTSFFQWGFAGDTGRYVAMYLTDDGGSGKGWTIAEIFYLRIINQEASASSTFSATSPDLWRGVPYPTRWIGHELALCIHRTEPWLIEVLNSTRSVEIVGVLGNAASVDDPSARKGRLVAGGGHDTGGVGRILSSQDLNKTDVYIGAYAASTNVWIGQAGNKYTITPLDASWTDGSASGYLNFTTFNVSRFETFRGINSAKTILPLLAGSQQIVARRYKGIQVAFARILPIPMAVAIGTLFLAGVIGCFCIPALPNGIPQRRFDLYSWVTAIEGDGLRMEQGDKDDGGVDPTAPLRQSGEEGKLVWRPGMPMETVEKEFGTLRMRLSVKP